MLFRFLPRSARVALIRKSIRFPPLPPGVAFKVAETRAEHEQAFSLLHDCYVRLGLMAPARNGMRCTLFSALPCSTQLIARMGDAVIATVSLISDSPVGLPSDSDFRRENDLLRLSGRNLAEVSALAVHPEFRRKKESGTAVSLSLMKFLREVALRRLGRSTLCATVHPRARDFYEAFWGFETSERTVAYGFVNQALASHVWGGIDDSSVGKLERSSARFLLEDEPAFRLPPPARASFMSAELLEHFLVRVTGLIHQLGPAEFSLLRQAYEPLLGNEALASVFHRWIRSLSPELSPA